LKKLALLFAVGAATAAAQAQTSYTYSGPAVPIPDSPDGTCGTAVYAEINVPDTTTVGSVNVGFYIPHPFQGDLTISLRHMTTGHEVVLVNRPGNPQSLIGFGAANYGTATNLFTLADSATNSYDLPQVNTPGVNNVTGTWKPEAALAAFSGESASGAWRLIARDCAGMDTGSIVGFSLKINASQPCYANCDNSTTTPYLSVADLTCFLNKFAAGDPYANCDQSTQPPVLNVADFTCFLQKYAAGCTAP
jgi:subtilisin-like proprotein convertase family protein